MALLSDAESFQKPLAWSPDSYPHVPNGGEEQDERLQGTFAKRASLRRALWFGTRVSTDLQQVHGKRGQQTQASGSDRQREALAVLPCDTHL